MQEKKGWASYIIFNRIVVCYAMSHPHHINMWDGVMNHSLLSTIYIVFMVSEPAVFSRVSSRNQHLYRCIGKGPSSITLIWPKSQLEGRIVQFFLLPTSTSSISTILSASSGPIFRVASVFTCHSYVREGRFLVRQSINSYYSLSVLSPSFYHIWT